MAEKEWMRELERQVEALREELKEERQKRMVLKEQVMWLEKAVKRLGETGSKS